VSQHLYQSWVSRCRLIGRLLRASLFEIRLGILFLVAVTALAALRIASPRCWIDFLRTFWALLYNYITISDFCFRVAVSALTAFASFFGIELSPGHWTRSTHSHAFSTGGAGICNSQFWLHRDEGSAGREHWLVIAGGKYSGVKFVLRNARWFCSGF